MCSGSRWHCRLRHGPAAALKLGSPGCCSALLRSWGFQGFQLHFRSGMLSLRGRGPTAGTDPALPARQGRADVLSLLPQGCSPGGPEICTEPCREPVRAGEQPSRAALFPSTWPSCSSLLLPEVIISTRLVWAPQRALLAIFPAAPSRSSSAGRRQERGDPNLRGSRVGRQGSLPSFLPALGHQRKPPGTLAIEAFSPSLGFSGRVLLGGSWR